jgi:ArsR family transcriptional regulator, arsenate/arsenite/antimonite-responsive transcriptional repressor / arsenate reductase (thioredoxin)
MYAVTHREPPSVLKLVAHEVRWQLLSRLAYSDYRVNELGTLLQKPLNLVSYHLRLLRGAAIVQERRSSADARDVYYSLDLEQFQTLYQSAAEALHPALGAEPADRVGRVTVGPPARVLFLCTHNSARSQMAEALLRHLVLRHLGGDQVEVFSAGTEVTRVHPQALVTLERQGIETSGLHSKHLNQLLGQQFDYVITVCDRASESCPIFPGDPERIHWSFPDPSAVTDPAEQQMAFTQVFVGLEKRLKLLLTLIARDRGQA